MGFIVCNWEPRTRAQGRPFSHILPSVIFPLKGTPLAPQATITYNSHSQRTTLSLCQGGMNQSNRSTARRSLWHVCSINGEGRLWSHLPLKCGWSSHSNKGITSAEQASRLTLPGSPVFYKKHHTTLHLFCEKGLLLNGAWRLLWK